MALNTGINSLDAGAPDITYTGTEGPQDPRMASAPNANAELYQMYQNMLNAGALPQGMTFEMFKERWEQSQGMRSQERDTRTAGTYTQRRRNQMAYGGTPGADGRKAYGIGSFFQEKIKDPIAKLIPNELKNPLGLAALTAASTKFLPEGYGKGWLGDLLESAEDIPYIGPIAKGLGTAGEVISGIGTGARNILIGDPSDPASTGIFGIKQPYIDKLTGLRVNPLNIAGPLAGGAAAGLAQQAYLEDQPPFPMDETSIRFQTAKEAMADPELRFKPEAQYANVAEGGRIGYAGGGTWGMDTARREWDILGPEGKAPYEDFVDFFLNGPWGSNVERRPKIAQGGRVPAQEGGLMNLGGMEKDYRQEGGFVPIGGQEKADDVPARLSKNEFVFTADAVRAAGGGDIDAGAEVMENVMENLEAGGKVSEESQGLEGARGMFANAQQLEKRII